jgi:hypothetical protein
MGKKRRKHSLLPMQEMRVETQNGCPHLLVLHFWRAGEIQDVVKDNGSGWLRWVLKQGGIMQVYSNHRDTRCALELPFAGQVF